MIMPYIDSQGIPQRLQCVYSRAFVRPCMQHGALAETITMLAGVPCHWRDPQYY